MEINIAVSEVVTQTWIPSLTLGVSLKVGRTDKAKAFLQVKNIWNQRIQDYLSEREAKEFMATRCLKRYQDVEIQMASDGLF